MSITVENRPPILDYDAMATILAEAMGDYGFLFVEDPLIPALSASLRAFVAATGLPVNPPNDGGDDCSDISALAG